jgi:uncharacterized protein YaaR (DUF327 family)
LRSWNGSTIAELVLCKSKKSRVPVPFQEVRTYQDRNKSIKQKLRTQVPALNFIKDMNEEKLVTFSKQVHRHDVKRINTLRNNASFPPQVNQMQDMFKDMGNIVVSTSFLELLTGFVVQIYEYIQKSCGK